MGYRSDVALVLYKQDYLNLMSAAQQLKDRDELCLLENEPSFCEVDNKEYVAVKAEFIKWNDRFAETKLVEDFIKNVPHAFIRIGQEYEDFVIDYEYGDNDDYNFKSVLYPVRFS